MMKKDKEWAKGVIRKELEAWRNTEGGIDRDGIKYVLNIIDQLDEPEVLSQEWIYSYSINASSNGLTKEYVHVDDLKNLMVPKYAITFDEVHDKLREESILSEKSFDYYWNCINDNIEIDEPKNLIIPKQELPVIPKYVDEYISLSKNNISLKQVLEKAIKRDEWTTCIKVYSWISSNDEMFARAWLDGYKVAEEQKYYVDLNTAAYVAKWKDDDRVGIYTDSIFGSDEFEFRLTEQEIKNYDERFWPFAKPVE